jgi:acetyltransferase-like isoleucine patch superfamily enzyme
MMADFRHYIRTTRSSWRRLRFRARGIQIDGQTTIEPGVQIDNGLRPTSHLRVTVGRGSHLSRGVLLQAFDGAIEVGTNVFIGPYAVIYGHGGVHIGANTLVSMHCRILSSNHTIPPAEVSIRSQPDVKLPTKIGRDVWLGAGVTVLGGVEIGDGAVVGAGAVVTHDLPPYSISHGVPARVVGQRPSTAA